ncbi:H+-ATPase subunit H [Methanophagales archaeon]|nr:H+-ATPase subunit H [Methanophagales archaeon]
MAVEALRFIKEREEAGQKQIETAKERAIEIARAAEEEVKGQKEAARVDEKNVAFNVADKYAKEGGVEEKELMKSAEVEAEKLRSIAESNIEITANIVLEKILGLG